MGILGNLLKTQSNSTRQILEESQEVKTSSGNFTLETDVYKVKIKDMYAIVSSGGALGIRLILGYGDNFSNEYREDIYISNKEKKFTFIDKKDGKEKPLPGYALINDICCLCTDSSLAGVAENTVEQVKKVYDFKTKSEVNESHETYVDLIDQIFLAGIVKQEEPKKKYGSDGKLYTTDETRFTNHIQVAFDSETMNTLYEFDHAEGEDVPEHKAYDSFMEDLKGKIIKKKDKSDNTTKPSNDTVPVQHRRSSLRRNA